MSKNLGGRFLLIFGTLAIVNFPNSVHAQMTKCMSNHTNCKKACPTAKEGWQQFMRCWEDCNEILSSCVARNKIAFQCNSLPISTSSLGSTVQRNLRKKRAFLEETKTDIETIKTTLQSEFSWKVGKPGSAPEAIAQLALMTKTITDLIEGLGGFQATKTIKKADEIYDQVKDLRTAHAIVEGDIDGVVTRAIDLVGGRIPLVNAALVVKDFRANVIEMTAFPERLNEARTEYLTRIGLLEKQIEVFENAIEDVDDQLMESDITQLLQTYQAVRSRCEADIK